MRHGKKLLSKEPLQVSTFFFTPREIARGKEDARIVQARKAARLHDRRRLKREAPAIRKLVRIVKMHA